ncbi:hypothetical protein HMF3257_10420 [Spirosoma telluris]|uniref:Uncharacterized protein n=1 Tax=Spirosoma telluris TaxID=2183553 RepID=A0A327NIB6_9BACT|nr:hypothetical protein HMF3257_10420 [Spirosoma telluris]
MDGWLIITGILIGGPALILLGAYLNFRDSARIRKICMGKVFVVSGIMWILLLLIGVGLSGWLF